MQDIVQKLLEENTEILTKYEKLTEYKLMDSDIVDKETGYQTQNRSKIQNKPNDSIKTAFSHLKEDSQEVTY